MLSRRLTTATRVVNRHLFHTNKQLFRSDEPLTAASEESLVDKASFLVKVVGMDQNQLKRAVEKHPQLLEVSSTVTQQAWEHLTDECYRIPRKSLKSAVRRQPALLTALPGEMDECYKALVGGLGKQAADTVITRQAGLLAGDPEDYHSRIKLLEGEGIGISRADIGSVVERAPSLLTTESVQLVGAATYLKRIAKESMASLQNIDSP